MKRKGDELEDTPRSKKPTTDSLRNAFRNDLFEKSIVESYRHSYATSSPYPHAVVPSLIEDSLLRGVRNEIKEHIHFTLKETDIYRIHQSGDLANLSNLDAESLKHLPSLVRLRDALYSPDFREWVSTVTGAGKVSGQKTDMAVNVYTPGSYLLCHDDVIGSRRVSYILYLTDPDRSWRKEWGGGLRLFPTEAKRNKTGEDVKVPLPEHALNIPPSFGQLSFFAVRPGESYHDVEEVYYPTAQEAGDDDGGRIRMAISGWYHIPQSGEDGFEEGIEQAQAQQSSLAQLKGAANEFDEPQPMFRHYDEPRTVTNSSATAPEIDPGDESDTNEDILTEQDLTFLLHYISPSFLTPDMIDQFSASFTETSVLQLEKFFNSRFADELKAYMQSSEQTTNPSRWQIARPPHKQRYLFLQANESLHADHSPISRILTDLLHSHAFKKWLALVTGLPAHLLIRQNVLARHFRRGHDYALASPFTGDQPQLEFTIGMTPGPALDSSVNGEQGEAKVSINGNAHAKIDDDNTHTDTKPDDHAIHISVSQPDLGGEEIYMAGEDDDDDDAPRNNPKDEAESLPAVGKKPTTTTPTSTRNEVKADPAVYRSPTEDDDDGILFSDTPSWNTFSVVLRDKGVLRFIKYVCRAGGGRWDVKGEVEVAEGAFDDDGEEDEEVQDEDGEEDEDEGGDENEDEIEQDEEEENGEDDDADDVEYKSRR